MFSDMHMQVRMIGNLKDIMGFSVSVFQIPSSPFHLLFLLLHSQMLQEVRSLALQHCECDVVQHECACAPLPMHCKSVLFTCLGFFLSGSLIIICIIREKIKEKKGLSVFVSLNLGRIFLI